MKGIINQLVYELNETYLDIYIYIYLFIYTVTQLAKISGV